MGERSHHPSPKSGGLRSSGTPGATGTFTVVPSPSPLVGCQCGGRLVGGDESGKVDRAIGRDVGCRAGADGAVAGRGASGCPLEPRLDGSGCRAAGMTEVPPPNPPAGVGDGPEPPAEDVVCPPADGPAEGGPAEGGPEAPAVGGSGGVPPTAWTCRPVSSVD